MENAKGKQHTSLATALLFISLAITPLSLRALGISPNFGAGVEAWRHIAGLLGDGQQPISPSEMSARNSESNEPAPVDATPTTNFLLASIEPMFLINSPAATAAASMPAAPAVRHCTKAAAPAAREGKAAPIQVAAVTLPVPAVEVQAGALFNNLGNAWKKSGAAARVPVGARFACDRVVRTYYQSETEKHRAEIDQAMKFLPKGFKVVVRLQGKAAPSFPSATAGYEFRKVFSPEKLKQLRVAELGPLSLEQAAPDTFNNSEL